MNPALGGGTSAGRQSSTGRSIRGAASQFSREIAPWLYAGALVCLIGIVATVYLQQTTYVAWQMLEMEDLETQLRYVRWVNNDLLLQIAEHQHMSRIEEEAMALGFAPAQEYLYVEVVVEERTSPEGGGTEEGSSGQFPLWEYLPDWLQRLLEQFVQWAAGPMARAEQAGE